jgi:hypothetical protein
MQTATTENRASLNETLSETVLVEEAEAVTNSPHESSLRRGASVGMPMGRMRQRLWKLYLTPTITSPKTALI